MASNGASDQKSYLYAGLAGETEPGRPVHSGLYRLLDGGAEWEPVLCGPEVVCACEPVEWELEPVLSFLAPAPT